MTPSDQVTCTRCEGRGLLRHHLYAQRICPLCFGTGLVPARSQPINFMQLSEEELAPVHAGLSTELLLPHAGTVPRTSTQLLLHHRKSAAELHELSEKQPAHHQDFVRGAETGKRNFVSRLRAR